jgi:peptidyl-prolyl cis-trans isomerase C
MAQPLQSDVLVNGERITAADIAAEAQNHAAPKGQPDFAVRAAARALAVRALLLQEARQMDLSPCQRILGPGRRETEDEALMRAVIESRVEPAAISEAACRAFHAANADRFCAPTLYEAAHILLPAADDNALAQAEAESTAYVLLAELARSPDAFDRLAEAHSACSSRAAGGRLGQISTGDTVPEFEAVLDELDVGQIAPDPVSTRYGMHIVRLDARAPGGVLPYDTVAPRIREMFEKNAWGHAAKGFVAELVAAADISGVDFCEPADPERKHMSDGAPSAPSPLGG